MIRHALPIAALAFVAAAGTGRLRLNLSESVPIGLYAVDPGALPHSGSLVQACLPEPLERFALDRGYLQAGKCSGGAEPVLKPVAATAGDMVDITSAGVAVNGEFIVPPGLDRDSKGRSTVPMPAGHYAVPTGAIWLLSPHSAHSWDSRYYGAVPASSVRGEAWPLLVLP